MSIQNHHSTILTKQSVLRVLGLLLIVLVRNSCGLCQGRDENMLGQQLTLSCDNNYLLFNGDDGYYTSGLFLQYDRVSRKHNADSSKKVFSYEIGQMIYTAHTRKILPVGNSVLPGGVEQIDRPIAGYLFGKATYSSFHRNRRMLGLSISAGTIGENSLARRVQEFWHRVIGVKDYWNWIWDYQVKNEVGVNVHTAFAYSLVNNKAHPSIQVTPVTRVTLGTTTTNLSQGVLFQVGRLRPMTTSSYWHSRFQSTHGDADSPMEFFLHYKPEVIYQLYNATIQGGLLNEDKGPVISPVQPFVVSHEIGVTFSVPRYYFAYLVTLQTREAKTQFYRQSFAGVKFGFRFG